MILISSLGPPVKLDDSLRRLDPKETKETKETKDIFPLMQSNGREIPRLELQTLRANQCNDRVRATRSLSRLRRASIPVVLLRFRCNASWQSGVHEVELAVRALPRERAP